MADQWYVGKGGKKHGPFTNEQLKKLAATGKIDRTDQLWKEGMEKWVPCSSAKGLFVAAAPASLAPPPPAFDNPLAAPDSDDPTAAFSGFEMPAYVPTPEEPPPLKPAEPPATSGYTPIKKASRQLEYAGFIARGLAMTIDGVVLMIPLVLFSFLIMPPVAELGDGKKLAMAITMTQIVGNFVIVSYSSLMESSRRGGTVGKQAMRIRVTDLEGRRIGLGRAVWRNVAKPFSAFLLLGFILALLTPRKQTLHDLVSGTVVVKA